MLELHAIDVPATQPDIAAMAEPHAADAIRTLVEALDDPDTSARVAAAVALLAICHQQPLQVLAYETAGVAVAVNAGGESDFCNPTKNIP